MDAALLVLDQKSIADATVDDIVERAGLARGTFYIYFRDKYHILAGLAERLNSDLFRSAHDEVAPVGNTYDRLRASLHRVIEEWVQHAGLHRSMTQMALTRSDFLDLHHQLRAGYIARIKADLDGSIARGRARPIDTAVASKALSAMMDWFCLLWFALDEPPYPGAEKDIDSVVDNLALLWYRAIYARDPGGHQTQ